MKSTHTGLIHRLIIYAFVMLDCLGTLSLRAFPLRAFLLCTFFLSTFLPGTTANASLPDDKSRYQPDLSILDDPAHTQQVLAEIKTLQQQIEELEDRSGITNQVAAAGYTALLMITANITSHLLLNFIPNTHYRFPGYKHILSNEGVRAALTGLVNSLLPAVFASMMMSSLTRSSELPVVPTPQISRAFLAGGTALGLMTIVRTAFTAITTQLPWGFRHLQNHIRLSEISTIADMVILSPFFSSYFIYTRMDRDAQLKKLNLQIDALERQLPHDHYQRY